MLHPKLINRFTPRRLKALLAIFFLALAVPTAVLIWQARSQLKFEAFHQHRGLAEELTRRIDTRLADLLQRADAFSFADYTFLNVTGDTRYNFVQRSPLSEFPVAADLPGVIGYFQVDSDGTFSTPLLPPTLAAAEQLGIGAVELSGRQQLAGRIESILADNRLVRTIIDTRAQSGVAITVPDNEPDYASEEAFADDPTLADVSVRRVATPPQDAPAPDLEETNAVSLERRSFSTQSPAVNAGGAPMESPAGTESGAMDDATPGYSQQAFDRLNSPQSRPGSTEPDGISIAEQDSFENEREMTVGKVSELKLDAVLQKKSEDQELAEKEQRRDEIVLALPGRAKRREQIALPEAAAVADRDRIANVPGPVGLRINTFESEIDPLEFSQLGSGHLVLFRNVWRDGERFVQGILLEQAPFIASAIERSFRASALSAMSNLIVGYQDEVIAVHAGSGSPYYADTTGALQGALLYRSRLAAPLERLELIFSVSRLPPGPGATVIAWVTLVLALVFVGGFFTMYRLGLSQLRLARQQQDFVSAVSHELKTPLTSIRMYGEMLKEGWADEAKRQSYYEFIHDESERLTRMITNVLQLANIANNEPNFDLKPINVGELMSNIESKIATQVERAGFALEFVRNTAAENALLEIDADCFAQIIINLVDNAIKFSKHADTKTISITSKLTSDRQVEFTIRDYGPGIAPDQMKKVFRLFYRSESELTRETVGTGIGLAIVQQLATAMRGRVDVLNRNPGAEFRLSFPSLRQENH